MAPNMHQKFPFQYYYYTRIVVFIFCYESPFPLLLEDRSLPEKEAEGECTRAEDESVNERG